MCLVLQAVGGALSATGATYDAVTIGVNVSKAGLILQVIVLVTFLCLSADYLLALERKHPRQMSKPMRLFLLFILFAAILILVRCIYRIVELKDGYFAPNFRHQPEFIALEGA